VIGSIFWLNRVEPGLPNAPPFIATAQGPTPGNAGKRSSYALVPGVAGDSLTLLAIPGPIPPLPSPLCPIHSAPAPLPVHLRPMPDNPGLSPPRRTAFTLAEWASCHKAAVAALCASLTMLAPADHREASVEDVGPKGRGSYLPPAASLRSRDSPNFGRF
jgi:hypothetical protein